MAISILTLPAYLRHDRESVVFSSGVFTRVPVVVPSLFQSLKFRHDSAKAESISRLEPNSVYVTTLDPDSSISLVKAGDRFAKSISTLVSVITDRSRFRSPRSIKARFETANRVNKPTVVVGGTILRRGCTETTTRFIYPFGRLATSTRGQK